MRETPTSHSHPVPRPLAPGQRPWWNHSQPHRAVRRPRFSPTVIFAEFTREEFALHPKGTG
jgi:hypothetical protein